MAGTPIGAAPTARSVSFVPPKRPTNSLREPLPRPPKPFPAPPLPEFPPVPTPAPIPPRGHSRTGPSPLTSNPPLPPGRQRLRPRRRPRLLLVDGTFVDVVSLLRRLARLEVRRRFGVERRGARATGLDFDGFSGSRRPAAGSGLRRTSECRRRSSSWPTSRARGATPAATMWTVKLTAHQGARVRIHSRRIAPIESESSIRSSSSGISTALASSLAGLASTLAIACSQSVNGQKTIRAVRPNGSAEKSLSPPTTRPISSRVAMSISSRSRGWLVGSPPESAIDSHWPSLVTSPSMMRANVSGYMWCEYWLSTMQIGHSRLQ